MRNMWLYSCYCKDHVQPTITKKAAALIESILINHPFIDGNKRTGYVLMRSLLLLNTADITAGEEEKYAFVIGVAEGKLNTEAITTWLKDNNR